MKPARERSADHEDRRQPARRPGQGDFLLRELSTLKGQVDADSQEVQVMCEATVYLGNGGEEKEIMRDVVLVQPEDDAWLLVSLLGEQKLVRGTINRVDFLKHTVHLSQPPETAVES